MSAFDSVKKTAVSRVPLGVSNLSVNPVPEPTTSQVSQIAEVGEGLGFVDRSPSLLPKTLRRSRSQKAVGERTESLFISGCPVSLKEQFIRLADEKRMSYWEVLHYLLSDRS